MMDNKNGILLSLRRLGLSGDQAKVYINLLENGASSHLEIARMTGINRTKVYRLIDDLEKLSLAAVNISDEGKRVVPASPKNLEVQIAAEESEIESKKNTLGIALPKLNRLFNKDDLDVKFTVNTYEGTSGFKQMLWNELKTKGELLGFGSGTIEDLTGNKNWSEKHRAKTVEAGYKIREIHNPGKKPVKFTSLADFSTNFRRRVIDPAKLNLEHQIIIYNDTVATYHWRDDQKVGFEVINRAYAFAMRQVFENYWDQAEELET